MIRLVFRQFCLASILLLFCSPSNAFRSTKFESYTDPDYKGYTPKRVVLLVASQSFQLREVVKNRLIKSFEKKGVVIIPYRKLFPPTRTWSAEDQVKIYKRENIDSGLIVTAGTSSSAVIPIATQTYGTTNVFGSYGSRGTFHGSANSDSTSYNIYGARSIANFSAVLLDIGKNRTVWYADIVVKASGTAFVSKKGDAKGVTKGIIRGLEKDGHIKKKVK